MVPWISSSHGLIVLSFGLVVWQSKEVVNNRVSFIPSINFLLNDGDMSLASKILLTVLQEVNLEHELWWEGQISVSSETLPEERNYRYHSSLTAWMLRFPHFCIIGETLQTHCGGVDCCRKILDLHCPEVTYPQEQSSSPTAFLP